MTWVPFEERPRPPQLARARLTVDRLRRIEISGDEEDIGLIFAWLIGQVMLAKADDRRP